VFRGWVGGGVRGLVVATGVGVWLVLGLGEAMGLEGAALWVVRR